MHVFGLLMENRAQENPADLEAICGESLSEVQEAIQSACSGDELEAAEDAFSGTCAESGTTICTEPLALPLL